MGDFDRFKLRTARSLRNRIRTEAFKALKARASKSGYLLGKKVVRKTKKPRTKKPVDKKAKAAEKKGKKPVTAAKPAAKVAPKK